MKYQPGDIVIIAGSILLLYMNDRHVLSNVILNGTSGVVEGGMRGSQLVAWLNDAGPHAKKVCHMPSIVAALREEGTL